MVKRMIKRESVLAASLVASTLALSGCGAIYNTEAAASSSLAGGIDQARKGLGAALESAVPGQPLDLSSHYTRVFVGVSFEELKQQGLTAYGAYEIEDGSDDVTIRVVVTAQAVSDGLLSNTTEYFISCASLSGQRGSSEVTISDLKCPTELIEDYHLKGREELDASSLPLD